MKRRLPNLSHKLRELGFASYRDYLASDHWRALKAAWVPRRTRNRRPVCEFCLAGHLPLHLHHRTYKHLGAEQPRDLVMICEKCHGRVHRWFNAGSESLPTTTNAVRKTARRRF